MRLTNAMRDEISRTEMHKKFNDAKLKLQKELNDEVEKEVIKISPTVPKELENYVREGCVIYVGDTNYCLENYYPQKRHHRIEINKTKKIIKLEKELIELEKESRQFRSNLRTILYACTTDKQLTAKVPEFEIYFADKQKATTMAPVPASLIADVRKKIVRP